MAPFLLVAKILARRLYELYGNEGGDLLEGIVWLGVRAWVRECCRGFTGDGWECGCGGVTFI
jgi:hypothetical protein